MKDFREDFHKLLGKLKTGENFAFSRFSDGELFLLKNEKLVIDNSGPYSEQDHKSFDPDKHRAQHDKLVECLQFKKHNYFKGISCPCCVGEANFMWQVNLHGTDKNDEHLTWSNLFVNANYPLFMDHLVPALKGRDVVYVCNDRADLSALPFNLVKDFRVGLNCIVNDFDLPERMKEYVRDEGITDTVFLFSASSLSNYCIYELYKEFDKNTYIDIGTTLNPLIGLDVNRIYLRGGSTIGKVCRW